MTHRGSRKASERRRGIEEDERQPVIARLVAQWRPTNLVILVTLRAVMSLYDSAKKRVRVGSAYSKEFKVTVGVHQGSVLSPLLFAIVVGVY